MTQLALDGGTPVRKTLLPYGRQSVDETDIAAVVQVLRSDWLTTGPKVAEYERAWAERVGASCAGDRLGMALGVRLSQETHRACWCAEVSRSTRMCTVVRNVERQRRAYRNARPGGISTCLCFRRAGKCGLGEECTREDRHDGASSKLCQCVVSHIRYRCRGGHSCASHGSCLRRRHHCIIAVRCQH